MRRLQTYESFTNEQISYYRAESGFIGETSIFEPKGYYENIGDDDEPNINFGEHRISDTPEVCASKYIGGCVLGSYSMNRTGKYFIYEINEKPDKDISHWSNQDFQYLEEVRYRRTIKGKYIGEVILTNYQKKLFEILYKHFELSSDESPEEMTELEYEEFDKYWNDIEDGKLEKELKKIKVK